ncbi:putative heme d1 biosynthesis radical SAM protein NirJ1 [Desulfofundulus sp. TPOSR]|uniref:putative heme d1 biosynthesis radical SAM protein NirJ1 n=1 Tax=Desulfofundulus sp. TPOSR TaxID=2714340 RepID=UPI00140796FC|nr:putative heme d1 biosynthesis radical SAM protein NirJ1 [Desulfofundulus sp. TPOSR]NHM28393.1 putative heme d1 biosynthesis radical SAM protein NirJ1 [Desulfofundulus sp. TPOSR]
MISISKLLLDTANFGDQLRYTPSSRNQIHGTTAGQGPVVVWNMTRTCNLRCIHCYANADNQKHPGELTTAEAKKFIDDLAAFKVPVLLFSGGEPLMRQDFFELAAYATSRGIRTTVSTNGTLITPAVARRLKEIGVGYVGISLDGTGENNDHFRGRPGAFQAALEGIRNCLAVGQRVGLRFTINRHNFHQMEAIFDLIERENIPRVCFYHLVYSGRGKEMLKDDITQQESRAALDLIMERTLDFHRRGLSKEILTVDNHADGIYVYLKLRERDLQRAERVYQLLLHNGGNRSGIAIAAVDWEGNVHPDQFTPQHTFGNVREKSFGEIWTDLSQPILAGLKNRRPLLKGRCARCRWLEICNGNFRTRAEAVFNDFWAPDPACYLTDEEIGIA